MRAYSFEEAKSMINAFYKQAENGEFGTREEFLTHLDRNPHIAVQGYNAFGKIFHWNVASSHLYGYRESEAINQDRVELILPQEMRQLARSMIATAEESGKMPEPSSCELLHYNGHYVTVFSGHLVFQWDDATTPEFYCIELAINSSPASSY